MNKIEKKNANFGRKLRKLPSNLENEYYKNEENAQTWKIYDNFY